MVVHVAVFHSCIQLRNSPKTRALVPPSVAPDEVGGEGLAVGQWQFEPDCR